MKQSWTWKLASVAGLALLLQIPAFWIRGILDERSQYRNQALEEVQAMSGGAQVLSAPVLTIPYWVRRDSSIPVREYLHLHPARLAVEGSLPTDIRKRGIFQIPVYTAKVQMSFSFDSSGIAVQGLNPDALLWEEAFLSVALSDPRGLRSIPVLRDGKAEAQFFNTWKQGQPFRQAFSVPLVDARALVQEHRELSAPFELGGADSFHLLPYAGEASVNIRSDWTSPSFSGFFLPQGHDLSATGFHAQWKVTALNHSVPMSWAGYQELMPESTYHGAGWSGRGQSTYSNGERMVGFRLVDPVDHYTLVERSLKYCILFIALTFVLALFAEMLSERNIHAFQYLLIGLSLLLFYTLLLSIGERTGFAPAYAIATSAIVLQVSVFLHLLLKSLRTTLLCGGMLALLYGALFLLLQMEEMALLVGSVALFAVLALLMYLSLRVPWFRSGTAPLPPVPVDTVS